ncbi:hypothetical protein T08_6924 [Trichinella sp. T8]|nr:hypothetical protein T08_6924 [Trichinella sp. T8]
MQQANTRINLSYREESGGEQYSNQLCICKY